MQHFANFGTIRKANKIKKKSWEATETGEASPNRWDINEIRSMRTYESDPTSRTLRGIDRKNYSDIRKTNDLAASETGYLGFQKDPYKGLGGMMEEPVPYSGKKSIIVKY